MMEQEIAMMFLTIYIIVGVIAFIGLVSMKTAPFTTFFAIWFCGLVISLIVLSIADKSDISFETYSTIGIVVMYLPLMIWGTKCTIKQMVTNYRIKAYEIKKTQYSAKFNEEKSKLDSQYVALSEYYRTRTKTEKFVKLIKICAPDAEFMRIYNNAVIVGLTDTYQKIEKYLLPSEKQELKINLYGLFDYYLKIKSKLSDKKWKETTLCPYCNSGTSNSQNCDKCGKIIQNQIYSWWEV